MKNIFLIIFLFQLSICFSQRHSEKVIDEKIYGSPTKWSCIDKHFGFIFVNYAMSLPIINTIENAPASGKFVAGYNYRFKIVKVFDIGAELNYSTRFSNTKKHTQHIDNQSIISKIKTFNHNIESSVFFRFNISKTTHRNLGFFIDLGSFYSYSFAKNFYTYNYTNDYTQKTKYKTQSLFYPHDYGLYLKIAYNYISIFSEYSFGHWLYYTHKEDVCNCSDRKKYIDRNGLLIGIQLNLYTK